MPPTRFGWCPRLCCWLFLQTPGAGALLPGARPVCLSLGSPCVTRGARKSTKPRRVLQVTEMRRKVAVATKPHARFSPTCSNPTPLVSQVRLRCVEKQSRVLESGGPPGPARGCGGKRHVVSGSGHLHHMPGFSTPAPLELPLFLDNDLRGWKQLAVQEPGPLGHETLAESSVMCFTAVPNPMALSSAKRLSRR